MRYLQQGKKQTTQTVWKVATITGARKEMVVDFDRLYCQTAYIEETRI